MRLPPHQHDRTRAHHFRVAAGVGHPSGRLFGTRTRIGKAVNAPDLSILAVTCQQEGYLPAALASIDAQSFRGSVEVLVADDASTDGSLDILRQWSRSARYPVRILDAQPRLGIQETTGVDSRPVPDATSPSSKETTSGSRPPSSRPRPPCWIPGPRSGWWPPGCCCMTRPPGSMPSGRSWTWTSPGPSSRRRCSHGKTCSPPSAPVCIERSHCGSCPPLRWAVLLRLDGQPHRCRRRRRVPAARGGGPVPVASRRKFGPASPEWSSAGGAGDDLHVAGALSPDVAETLLDTGRRIAVAAEPSARPLRVRAPGAAVRLALPHVSAETPPACQ